MTQYELAVDVYLSSRKRNFHSMNYCIIAIMNALGNILNTNSQNDFSLSL